MPLLHLNMTDLSGITQHSDAVKCFTLWIPISSRYLASANWRWLSHCPRFNSNADIKGLILIYIKVTLHCCQYEWEQGHKEKLRGRQKWFAGMISFYRGYILGIRKNKQTPKALYSVLFLLKRLKKYLPWEYFQAQSSGGSLNPLSELREGTVSLTHRHRAQGQLLSWAQGKFALNIAFVGGNSWSWSAARRTEAAPRRDERSSLRVSSTTPQDKGALWNHTTCCWMSELEEKRAGPSLNSSCTNFSKQQSLHRIFILT